MPVFLEINKDLIRPGMRHRPMTNPRSSLYGKEMCPKYITVHEAWTTATAEQLHSYVLSQRAADRPASWHFSVDQFYIGQSLPFNESGWHAGDNLGPGNTTTIGTEIIDRFMRIDQKDEDKFWLDVTASCILHAWIIQNVNTLLPFPECLIIPDNFRQHNHWSGKNCPAILRGMPDGWSRYLDIVEGYLKETIYVKIIKPEKEKAVLVYDDTLIEGIDPDIDREWIKANIKEFEDEKDPYEDKIKKANYRVIISSYQSYKRALSAKRRIQGVFPTFNLFIVLNEVNNEKYFRVVLGEFDRRDHAAALVNKASEKDENAWIVRDWEDLSYDPDKLIEEEPEEEEPEEDFITVPRSILQKILDLLKQLLGIK